MAIEAGRIVTVADFQRRVGASANRTTNSATFLATEIVLDTITVSLVAGTDYRIIWDGSVSSTTGALSEAFRGRIRENNISGTELQVSTYGLPIANTAFRTRVEAEYTAVATGSKTFVATGVRLPAGGGTLTSTAGGTSPTLFRVEIA